ncbi:hypothetical protein HMPREF0208_03107 [Citrobacter koseri]|nr:hypothetical protein HMPREF3207_04777 [Citrobacter koseri]KWZ99274.1 hypothetical protein HMPREF3220_02193 [Citrobacter koseri]KXB42636.1 hypothetical protein HMPREF0208_03107 [Citrobacter koseri]
MPDDDADASYPACNLSEQLSAYISALAFSPMYHVLSSHPPHQCTTVKQNRAQAPCFDARIAL